MKPKKIMNMHDTLKKFWKENDENYLLQPMTAWFSPWKSMADEPKGIKGFIFENHIGIQNVKDIAGEGLYVYAMRHGDDWCKPCDIENREVVVNFYAYFVTDQSLDHFFSPKKDWRKIYTWSMDWGEEPYWED